MYKKPGCFLSLVFDRFFVAIFFRIWNNSISAGTCAYSDTDAVHSESIVYHIASPYMDTSVGGLAADSVQQLAILAHHDKQIFFHRHIISS